MGLRFFLYNIFSYVTRVSALMAIKYSLTNGTWYASQSKPKLPTEAKKEADALKNLQWKTLKGILREFHLTVYKSLSIFKGQHYAIITMNTVIFSHLYFTAFCKPLLKSRCLVLSIWYILIHMVH